MKHIPPKVGILIQNTFSKFSKTKNQTNKRAPMYVYYSFHAHGTVCTFGAQKYKITRGSQ